MFSLCRACSELTVTYSGEALVQPCMHNQQQRTIRTYLNQDQLRMAFLNGYKKVGMLANDSFDLLQV